MRETICICPCGAQGVPGCQREVQRTTGCPTESESAGALLGLCETLLSLAKITEQWSLALGGLWEASWGGGPGIGDSSVERRFLWSEPQVWRGLAPKVSWGLEVCKHRLEQSCTHGGAVGVYVS